MRASLWGALARDIVCPTTCQTVQQYFLEEGDEFVTCVLSWEHTQAGVRGLTHPDGDTGIITGFPISGPMLSWISTECIKHLFGLKVHLWGPAGTAGQTALLESSLGPSPGLSYFTSNLAPH